MNEGQKPASDNSAALLPRRTASSPALGAPYAPGIIRTATDRESAMVASFVSAHPEYGVLGHEGILAMAETYLDEDDHEERALLAAEGVSVMPYGFDGGDDRSDEDDIYGSDYR